MYTVRGYKEYEIIADGGTLVSLQYEFDLVKYNQSKEPKGGSKTGSKNKNKYELRKLAPLVFFDYGRAKIEDPLPTENRSEDLCSIGIGTLVEIGDNFSGALYYGFPLNSTDETSVGSGRLNVGLLMRW
jgi:hemolysin activation/secretion protein